MEKQMKDSGINWIGKIPDSWSVIKVKYLATDDDTLFLDGDWIESDVIEESGIRYLTTGNVGVGCFKKQGSGYISSKTFKELHCLKVFPGDLIISRLNEPIGRACIVPSDEEFYVVAVDIAALRPNKDFDKRFLMYVMNTEGYAENGNMIARGATMSRISRSQLGQFFIAYPRVSEQQAIANYLDKKCAKIDNIVSDLEKQIELLNKYKKSLITETVTKGLDKSVPMKDSGIEWIGKIPEDWSVKRVKYVIDDIKDGTHGTYERIESGKLLLSAKNVFDDGIRIGQNESEISEVDYKSIVSNGFPQRNDVLLCCVGTVGRTCVYEFDVSYAFQRSVAFLRPLKETNAQYLKYVLQSNSTLIQEQLLINKSAQEGLYMGNIRELIIPYPSEIYIQEQIANFLNNKLSKIDEIVKGKIEQKDSIIKFKNSIIYEYVTGKKRVKVVHENGN